MKSMIKSMFFSAALMLFAYASQAQNTQTNQNSKQPKSTEMKTYVIEREIPGVSKLTPEELKGVSQKSCGVLNEMGADNIQWMHSYVAGNKIYCVYKAKNEELVREHAKKGGFPANTITGVAAVISPETAK